MTTPSEYTQFVIAMDKSAPGHHVVHAITGLAGECGEVCQILTKALRSGRAVAPLRIKDELGDCLWFLTRVATLYGYNLDDVMEHNVRKLQERYGSK